MTGYFYKKIRARNEALDLKTYNLAAVALLNPNWERLAAKMERPPLLLPQTEADEQDSVSVGAPAPLMPQKDEPQKKYAEKPPRHVTVAGWTNGWRR